MTRNSDAVNRWQDFLESKHAYEDDARLISQVHVWEIVSRVQEKFGTNVESPLSAELMPQVRRFIIELDICRADWSESFSRNAHIGNYPKNGRPTMDWGMIPEVNEIVNTALLSASSILTSLTLDEDIQLYLDGLPSYFFTMITFAAVFLLKVALRYSNVSCIHRSEIFDLMHRVVETVQKVSQTMHQKHLLASIAHGLDKILTCLKQDGEPHSQRPAQNGMSQPQPSIEKSCPKPLKHG